MKSINVCLGIDVDAVAGWIGSYGGQESPNDIQRGVFAAEVGTPRLLQLFDREGITTSWFVPGHSAESFPEQMRMIVEAGHDVGAHGYLHENPVDMSPQQEEDVMGRSLEALDQVLGVRPRGYVAPWWEMSAHTVDLLRRNGFTYDHSQSYRDFQPFYARTGEEWTRIDYGKDAESWMKPLVHGEEVDLVEFSASWYLDDLPPMMFIKNSPNSHGFVNPRDLEQQWCDQFDWVYRELDYAVFPITLHPDVSGRPQVLLMLERVIAYLRGHDGVRFMSFAQAEDDFRRRYPFDGRERPTDTR